MRQSWDSYWLDMAKLISTRATCPRASVGCVIVKGNYVITSGYNGALAGEPHCVDVGCDLSEEYTLHDFVHYGDNPINEIIKHCQRAIHAEVNAIAQAARLGKAVDGATLYLYDSGARMGPCRECQKVILASGVVKVVS
jgi:dCMP deaminase